MAKRIPPKQSAHDKTVKQIARGLENKGWNVQADVPGYAQPDGIGSGNRRPDIRATKQGHTRLVEVETPESLSADKQQQSTFRRHAGQKPNTTFEVVVTDE